MTVTGHSISNSQMNHYWSYRLVHTNLIFQIRFKAPKGANSRSLLPTPGRNSVTSSTTLRSTYLSVITRIKNKQTNKKQSSVHANKTLLKRMERRCGGGGGGGTGEQFGEPGEKSPNDQPESRRDIFVIRRSPAAPDRNQSPPPPKHVSNTAADQNTWALTEPDPSQ